MPYKFNNGDIGIGNLCNIVFPMSQFHLHRDFTDIRESLNAMKHSFELCLL